MNFLKPLIVFLLTGIFFQLSAQRSGGYEPMSQKEWLGNYREYIKSKTALSASNDPEKHYQLGQWAWEHGLEDEAWEQWLVTIKYDENHQKSYAAIGFVKKDDQWVRPGELNQEWVEKVDESGRAFSYTFAFADDADEEFFEEFSWRVRRLNWFIWHLTEGQMYLKKIRLVDKSTEGRFIIEEGRLNQTLLTGGGAVCYNSGSKDWFVKSGGKCYMRILCHEFFHGIFGLPDERHGCFCIMQGGLYGIKTPDLKLCDRESHRESSVTPTSCWEIILNRYPDMNHEEASIVSDRGKAPETEITIVNQ